MKSMKRLFPSLILFTLLVSACAPAAPQATTAATTPTQTSASATQAAVSPATSATATAPATAPAAAVPAATQAAATPGALPTQTSAAAIACTSPAALTVALTEGPYFKAGSPERSSLIEANTTGTKLSLSGYVLDTNCQPVAHALMEVWQANAQGQYDNAGYTLRGHLYTDDSGHYQVETIVPGLYPGRTEHIHIKVQAPNGPVLTTQLFFPGVAGNDSDGIFDPSTLLNIQQTADGLAAQFNYIINTH